MTEADTASSQVKDFRVYTMLVQLLRTEGPQQDKGIKWDFFCRVMLLENSLC